MTKCVCVLDGGLRPGEAEYFAYIQSKMHLAGVFPSKKSFLVLSRSLQSSVFFTAPNKKRLSPAKSLVEELIFESGRSLIYSMKRRGPGTVPYGTPEYTVTESDEEPSRETR